MEIQRAEMLVFCIIGRICGQALCHIEAQLPAFFFADSGKAEDHFIDLYHFWFIGLLVYWFIGSLG